MRAFQLKGWGALALGLTLSACAGERQTTTQTSPPWRATMDWEFGLTDSTLLGSVQAVAVSESGRVVIADRIAAGLMVLHPEGRLERELGRRGEGPGEFGAAPVAVDFDRDGHVWAVDASDRTLVRYSRDGALIGETRLGVRTGEKLQPLHAGVVLRTPPVASAPEPWDGLVAAALEGEPRRVLTFERPPVPVATSDGRPRSPLLASIPVWAVNAEGRVAFAYSTDDRVQVTDPDGVVAASVPTGIPVTEPTSEDVVVLHDLLDQRAELGRIPRSFLPLLEIAIPERLPAFLGIAWGPGETLWLQAARSPSELDPALDSFEAFGGQGGAEWVVIDLATGATSRVDLGVPLWPASLRGPYLVGVARDGLGVERIVRFTLSRP